MSSAEDQRPRPTAREARRPLAYVPFYASFALRGVATVVRDHSDVIGWISLVFFVVGLGYIAWAVVGRRRIFDFTRSSWCVILGVDGFLALLTLMEDRLSWPVRVTACVVLLAMTTAIWLDQRHTTWPEPR